MGKEDTFNPMTGELMVIDKDYSKKEAFCKKHIFVSHHSKDEKIAESFCKLLEITCSHSLLVETFCASRAGDILSGKEWFPIIKKKLDVCTDIVCLFTKTSTARPWLLFEAGYAKALNVDVHGLFIGRKVIRTNHPFTTFQNIDYKNEKALISLVSHLLEGAIDVKQDDCKKEIAKNVKKFIKDNTTL